MEDYQSPPACNPDRMNHRWQQLSHGPLGQRSGTVTQYACRHCSLQKRLIRRHEPTASGRLVFVEYAEAPEWAEIP